MDPLEIACHYPLLLESTNRGKNASLFSSKSTSIISTPSKLTSQSCLGQSSSHKLSSTITRSAINSAPSWKKATKTQQQEDHSTIGMAYSVHNAFLGW
jgi:hypothetical protein